MRRITLFLAVFTIASSANVTAQNSFPLNPGDRIRLTAPVLHLDKYDGIVRAMGSDTLTVDSLGVALRSVTMVDVHRGKKSNVGKGALIGGSVVGIFLGAFAAGVCADSFLGSNCDSEAGAFAGGLVVGFAGGALLGAFVGAAIQNDRWEKVPLDQVRVSVAPKRDGRFAFGLSVAF